MEQVFSYEKSEADDYYRILGCTEKSSTEQIMSEFKARVLDVHPDKNPNDPLAEERFKLLKLAKETLVDSDMRRRYDTWRSCGLAVPFQTWITLGKNVQTSMHWATYRKSDDSMLEAPPLRTSPSSSSSNGRVMDEDGLQPTVNVSEPEGRRQYCDIQRWERDPCSNVTLQRFRNYEI